MLGAVNQELQTTNQSALSTSQAFLAGHSLGGIAARQVANTMGLAGLVLMGSYLVLNGTQSLGSYDIPVLTLGGSLDGLTRVTRIAEEYAQFSALMKQKPGSDTIIRTKPVIVLEGVSHSQFDTHYHVPGDTNPKYNISMRQAHSEMSEVINAFFTLNINNSYLSTRDKNAALSVLRQHVGTTDAICTPFLLALEVEASSWCVSSQGYLFNDTRLAAPTVTVQQKTIDSELSFADSKPHISTTSSKQSAVIDTTCHNEFQFNPADVSTIPVSAEDTRCKLKSQPSVQEALGLTPTFDGPQCAALNEQAIRYAFQNAQPTVQTRYTKYCAPLTTTADVMETTGISWLLTGLNVTLSESACTIQSSALETGLSVPFGLAGMHYCTLLSPARAMEYMMIDCLHNKFY